MPEQRIAHYNLLEKIGEGGLGVVYRARDTRIGRTVALKVLPESITSDGPRLQRLLGEATAVARLSHPGIATLFDVGQPGDVRYLAYEYVAGVPLGNEMAGRAMNPRRALEIAIQVADGLAYAHAAGIVHADVRPDAIALTGRGSAKLLDAGMSRWTRGGEVRRAAAENASALPAHALTIVSYMSPEQALGGAVDGRSDLFSLAALLYEMLTGRKAFAAPSAQDTAMHVISLHPPPPSSINSDVMSDVDSIIARALSKEISQRHAGVAAFAAELRGVVSALDARAGDSASSYVMPVDDRADRMPLAVWLAAGAAALGAGAVVWWALK